MSVEIGVWGYVNSCDAYAMNERFPILCSRDNHTHICLMIADVSSEIAVDAIQFVQYCDQRCSFIVRMVLLDCVGVI